MWLLQGPLPSSWSSLRGLITLALNNGFLEGTLPAAWSSLANLTSLQLQGNQLNGGCPGLQNRWRERPQFYTFL